MVQHAHIKFNFWMKWPQGITVHIYINHMHVLPHMVDEDVSSMGNPLAVAEIQTVRSSKERVNGPESIVHCIASARQPR
jgi:hypothetical protein